MNRHFRANHRPRGCRPPGMPTVMRLLLTILVGTGAAAWVVTHAQSQDETPAPTAQGTTLYRPLVANTSSESVQTEAVLPAERPELGLVYRGLEVDKSGGCRGLLRITQTTRCTHGPDLPIAKKLVAASAAPLAPSQTAAITPVTCAGDGVSGNRVQMLYVRASDQPDRYSQYLTSFQQWTADMDQIF